MKDFLESFEWHSSLGIDETIVNKKKKIASLPNTKKARELFIMAGENLLIHKSTNALWKLSKDKKSITPVFDTDILSADELEETEE
jgi:hypothetical protein